MTKPWSVARKLAWRIEISGGGKTMVKQSGDGYEVRGRP